MSDAVQFMDYCLAIPFSDDAKDAFNNYETNQKFRRCREGVVAQQRRQDREATPGLTTATTACLAFTLRPDAFRDPHEGLVFGSNPGVCDVLLDRDNLRGISGEHLILRHRIDKRVNKSNLLLVNKGKNPPIVNGEELVRGEAVCVDGRMDVVIGRIAFVLQPVIPESGNGKLEFQRQFDLLFERSEHRAIDPPLQFARLNIVSARATPALPQPKKGITKLPKRRKKQAKLQVSRADVKEYVRVGSSQPANIQRDVAATAVAQDYSITDARYLPVIKDDFTDVKCIRLDGRRAIYCMVKANGKVCLASKRILKSSDQSVEAMRREKDLATQINHDRIIRFLGAAEDERLVEVRMEHAGSNLEEMVHIHQGVSETDCGAVAVHMVQALIYLAEESLIHRDIKPSNILVTSECPPIFKLADFGVAYSLAADTDESNINVAGTVRFMAPELLRLVNIKIPASELRSFMSYALDIWSLGATLWYCRTGQYLRLEDWEAQQREDDDLPDTLTCTDSSFVSTHHFRAQPSIGAAALPDFSSLNRLEELSARNRFDGLRFLPEFIFAESGKERVFFGKGFLELIAWMSEHDPSARPSARQVYEAIRPPCDTMQGYHQA